MLVQHFVTKYNSKMGKKINSISRRTLEKMQNYLWPGNVRELEHLIERGVLISSCTTLAISDQLLTGSLIPPRDEPMKNLASNERNHIMKILKLTNWKIEGKGGAATILDINSSTFRARIKRYNIQRPS